MTNSVKKIFSLLILTSILIGFFGCSNNNEETGEKDEPEETIATIKEPEEVLEEDASPQYLGLIKTLEVIHIRTSPNEEAEKVGKAAKGTYFLYYEKQENSDYTWYKIADDMWCASDGEWIEEVDDKTETASLENSIGFLKVSAAGDKETVYSNALLNSTSSTVIRTGEIFNIYKQYVRTNGTSLMIGENLWVDYNQSKNIFISNKKNTSLVLKANTSSSESTSTVSMNNNKNTISADTNSNTTTFDSTGVSKSNTTSSSKKECNHTWNVYTFKKISDGSILTAYGGPAEEEGYELIDSTVQDSIEGKYVGDNQHQLYCHQCKQVFETKSCYPEDQWSYQKVDKAYHQFTCAMCKNKVKSEHDFQVSIDDEYTHSYYCSTCDFDFQEKHVWNDSHTECTVCGQTCPHERTKTVKDGCYINTVCSYCGELLEQEENHQFNEEGICKKCGATE